MTVINKFGTHCLLYTAYVCVFVLHKNHLYVYCHPEVRATIWCASCKKELTHTLKNFVWFFVIFSAISLFGVNFYYYLFMRKINAMPHKSFFCCCCCFVRPIYRCGDLKVCIFLITIRKHKQTQWTLMRGAKNETKRKSRRMRMKGTYTM